MMQLQQDFSRAVFDFANIRQGEVIDLSKESFSCQNFIKTFVQNVLMGKHCNEEKESDCFCFSE